MKKVFILCCWALLAASCVKKADSAPNGPAKTDVERYLSTQEFEVPVREGYVTKVIMDGETVAEAVSPMTILLPKFSATKAGEMPVLDYVPVSEYGNEVDLENRAKLYQVVCFEDSKIGDYDYNDLVIHVIYKIQGNRFGFGVQPVALGSTKPIKLGCAVYKGDTRIFKGLITPEGKNCREQYFESQEGFINTVGSVINQQNGGWGGYLGSTIRNWQINKYPGEGAMRVEWYIEVDNGVEIYALSTTYLEQSFDKNNLPCGLVITSTGASYTHNGLECGYDWFNYPRESQSIKDVYPQIWEWLNSNKAYRFADIYDPVNIPDGAYPASDLGLYRTTDVDVCNVKYRAD